MMNNDLVGAPCNKIKSFIESQTQKNQTQIQIDNQTFDLETMYQRNFRCGFKKTFTGALKRVFSGMNAVQHYEVTMMRKYESDNDVPFCHSGESTCFIAEFSFRSKFSYTIYAISMLLTE